MWSKEFWLDLLERAIRGAALAMLLVIGGDTANVFTLDVKQVIGFGLGGALISILMSLGASKVASKGTASFVPQVTYKGPADPLDTP